MQVLMQPPFRCIGMTIPTPFVFLRFLPLNKSYRNVMLHHFIRSVSHIPLPEKFTYPLLHPASALSDCGGGVAGIHRDANPVAR